MNRVEYAAPATASVRACFPLFVHEEHTLRSPRTGNLLYIHVVWATRRRWLRWAAKHSGVAATWHVTTLGPFVLAFGFSG